MSDDVWTTTEAHAAWTTTTRMTAGGSQIQVQITIQPDGALGAMTEADSDALRLRATQAALHVQQYLRARSWCDEETDQAVSASPSGAGPWTLREEGDRLADEPAAPTDPVPRGGTPGA